ncbi:MAG: N-acetylmuramoyl-L-alanine amidase [Clostridia bacterium]|nr:N-acetylmuramoyl-L-alanine amidase [Clostridia bacterium]
MKATTRFLSLFLVFVLFSVVSLAAFLLLSLNKQKNNDKKEELPQAEEPTPNLPTVVIDAGHGGEDGGAIGKNGAYEKDVNLAIALKLKEKLCALGIPCALTRSTDVLLYDRNVDYEGRKKKLDLLSRKEFAEKYENAVFISIHQNSYPKEQYSGFQVYFSPNDPTSRELAISLERNVRDALQPNNRRVCKEADSSIYLLDKLCCPAVLIECGFLSNPEECRLLCEEEYQDKLCEAVSESIAGFVRK